MGTIRILMFSNDKCYLCKVKIVLRIYYLLINKYSLLFWTNNDWHLFTIWWLVLIQLIIGKKSSWSQARKREREVLFVSFGIFQHAYTHEYNCFMLFDFTWKIYSSFHHKQLSHFCFLFRYFKPFNFLLFSNWNWSKYINKIVSYMRAQTWICTDALLTQSLIKVTSKYNCEYNEFEQTTWLNVESHDMLLSFQGLNWFLNLYYII